MTGRGAELAWLDHQVGAARPAPVVVSGPGGVGKSALVLTWAHAHLSDFPDGQLWVDLRGHGPDRPLTPDEALGAFLRDLGVPHAEVPQARHEREGRYRSLLHGRRVLVVLDNAASEDQVRPLLPGAGVVLVTSRNVLPGLEVHEGAEVLNLDLLSPDQGQALLRAALGDRVDREPAARELVAQCGGLPLALRIVAQLARSRPAAPLAELVAELRHAGDRLDALEVGGDLHSSIRPVLSWSLDRLPEDAARAFRLFGAHPTGVVEAPAFAALCGVSVARAARLLRVLVGAHMLAEPVTGRYGAHDLLRLFAVELAGVDRERVAAKARLFDHVLHTAERADALVTPNRYRVPLVGDPAGAEEFADYGSALAWLHRHWRDAVGLCAWDEPELDVRRWQLAYTMRGYFFLTKQWDGWLECYRSALAACLRLGDRHAEARIRNDLGRALLETGRPDEAAGQYESAQRLFEEIGDRHGWSNAVANRAVLLRRSGDLAEALRLNKSALDYYLEVGARRNAAIAWRSRAKMHYAEGALDEASADLDRAVAMFAELGSHLDLAEAYDLRGVIAARRGDAAGAEAQHLAALEASRACGSTLEEAKALHRLGDLAAARGSVDEAVARWGAAVRHYRSLGSPEAAGLTARLASMDVAEERFPPDEETARPAVPKSV
ncbi:tetratricopeptide repeat protein [Saccharothrix sp. S26]|uniref:tetratricopeptide repeat protein n=1 Tax=Saccharothrix sp. S26 TaxID=2907215 RepID=UPI001F18CEFA|nr:tetratricopeptide repeat protein [Saccharothrix sp. S26]MCE6997882.1 tetratricopeptide repeat protein [Saccharothrix sp. S26]